MDTEDNRPDVRRKAMPAIGIELKEGKISVSAEGFSLEGLNCLRTVLCQEQSPVKTVLPVTARRKPRAHVVVLCRCGICLRVITADNTGLLRVITNNISKLEEIKKEVRKNRERLISSVEETLRFVQELRKKYGFTVNREGIAEKLIRKELS